MWFDGAYFNELTLFVPGLLWPTVRQTAAQRVLDVLRTCPLAVCVVVHFVAQSVPLYAWLAVVAWTVVANLAQYRLDVHHDPDFSELTFVLLHVSVLHWLVFSLAPSSVLRIFGVAVNVVSALYLVAVLLFAVPYIKAWSCYPSRDVSTFTRGYCPQYTGEYSGNVACSLNLDGEDSYNPRCSPHQWRDDVAVHDVVGHAGHVVFHALAGTLAFHLAMIPNAAEQARISACIAVAHRRTLGWKLD